MQAKDVEREFGEEKKNGDEKEGVAPQRITDVNDKTTEAVTSFQ